MIYKIDELRHVVIGREIDGGITALRVDCSAWLERYPQLTQYRIEVTSPAGVVYIAETEFVDGILTWNITQADTSQPGDGQYQIVATGADGERKTSSHPRLTILDIMKGTAGDAPPAPSASWVDQVLDNAESAKTAAQNAEDAAQRAEDAAQRIEGVDIELPIATDEKPGIVKIGEGLSVDEDGTLKVEATGIVNESDPTVPSWAKEDKKPTYTAEEVGALPANTPVIYVGTEKPLDENVEVWIDPDGEAEPMPPATTETLGGVIVGEGLNVDEDGRVNVEPEPDYALITTIEGKEGEELVVIELDTTPDGKPYAFSAIRVEYVCHNTERLGAVSARFYYTNSEFAEITLGMSSMTPGAIAEHNAIVDHGMLSVVQTYWSNYEWVGNARQAQPRRYLIGDKKICKVRLNKSDYFDGLTLRIQGRA